MQTRVKNGQRIRKLNSELSNDITNQLVSNGHYVRYSRKRPSMFTDEYRLRYNRDLKCFAGDVIPLKTSSKWRSMKLTLLRFLLPVFFILLLFSFIFRQVKDTQQKNQVQEIVQSSEFINLYLTKDAVIKKIPLEEYVVGVVCAEMPASFEPEALKAQAVAARTYTLGRVQGIHSSNLQYHLGAPVCTDSTHCQAWIPKETALMKWPEEDREKYWNKIVEAVNTTSGEIILYQNTIINPLYHSNSGGYTENVQEVWSSNAIPYLQSVPSPGDIHSQSYEFVKEIVSQDLISTLKSKYPDLKCQLPLNRENLYIASRTSTDRVNEVVIGNTRIKGTDFRSIFSLSSTAFSFEYAKNSIVVTSHGFGHGVGMSQYGANYLASKGMDYREILKYYYLGVDIVKQ